MTSRTACLILLLVAINTLKADSPVGTWEISGKGRSPEVKGERFLGFVTFEEDGSVGGYFISSSLFTTVTLEGEWSFDEMGRVIANSNTFYDGENDSGVVVITVKRGKLKGSITDQSSGGVLGITGTIARATPNITGQYEGFSNKDPISFTLAATGTPNLFTITSNGENPFAGEVLIGQKEIFIWVETAEERVIVIGKFNAKKSTITGKGVEEDGERGRIKAARI